MKTSEFLAQLNHSNKDWGLWVNRDNPEENHVGLYSFENDRLPKSFYHVASLEALAHERQSYILSHSNDPNNEQLLGRQWADSFLSTWKVKEKVSS